MEFYFYLTTTFCRRVSLLAVMPLQKNVYKGTDLYGLIVTGFVMDGQRKWFVVFQKSGNIFP